MTVNEAPGNAVLAIFADGVGLFSWDIVANHFCGDAETARLFGTERIALSVGVTIEKLIDRLHHNDRKRLAEALHTAIIAGTHCRETYWVRAGRNQYRHVLVMLRCFGYDNGFPTVCSGFVCEMKASVSKASPDPQDQSNVVGFRPSL
jgi:hypothetical protein